ncbi:MAG TPA: PRC-barrel domain-containing protein [Chitinophagaceae bacterium]|jgi:sporulation protein YlmC with PRC-barrel domain|nr:PRC-barrel domain-containing protein [Chitinophagaceae bacterium]
MSKIKYDRLQELDHSNFEITKGDPDIRGWDVRYRNGERIGSVEELVLDTKAKKVRYMIVDLDENELRLEHRKVLIPIGFAELDNGNDDVLIPNVSVDQLCSLPDYSRNSLTHEVERKISSVFGRKVNVEPVKPLQSSDRATVAGEDVDPDFYSHEHYNTDNLYRNRRNKVKPKLNKESEYDDGLRLWEKRTEGEIIDTSDLTDEEREKLLKYRRELYRERRYKNESA